MAIPLATTTVQLLAPPEGGTDWGGAPDPADYTAVGDPVRAHLSLSGAGGGTAAVQPGSSTTTLTPRLICDPCGLTAEMLVLDGYSGEVYQVEWCTHRPPPMPHVVAGLSRVTATT